MSTRKSWFSVILLVGLFSFSATASSPLAKEPNTVTKQFSSLLKGLPGKDIVQGKTIYVDFMINQKGEVLVLATSNKKLDQTIKNRLNYKMIRTDKLESFKKYTLPVSFKK